MKECDILAGDQLRGAFYQPFHHVTLRRGFPRLFVDPLLAEDNDSDLAQGGAVAVSISGLNAMLQSAPPIGCYSFIRRHGKAIRGAPDPVRRIKPVGRVLVKNDMRNRMVRIDAIEHDVGIADDVPAIRAIASDANIRVLRSEDSDPGVDQRRPSHRLLLGGKRGSGREIVAPTAAPPRAAKAHSQLRSSPNHGNKIDNAYFGEETPKQIRRESYHRGHRIRHCLASGRCLESYKNSLQVTRRSNRL
ncbi:Hypothetical protein NGAL_HAMBI2605_62620 [Neorhizobium galegae bv. orientalis]|nr:Hypothetical protein NGAL_HAMBI2605_62620 [Neorhizobium galegae bv. orientalis]